MFLSCGIPSNRLFTTDWKTDGREFQRGTPETWVVDIEKHVHERAPNSSNTYIHAMIPGKLLQAGSRGVA